MMRTWSRTWGWWGRRETTTKILAGMAAGVAVGAAMGADAEWLRPIGTAFIRLLSMVVLPLVFASLTVGIASLGDIRAVGRIGVKTLVYYITTTVIAIGIGMALANALQPGTTIDAEARAKLLASTEQGVDAERVAELRKRTEPGQILLDAIPRNVVESMAKGDMVPVIVFALFFGAALAAIGKEKGGRVLDLLAAVNDAAGWMVGAVMKVAPLGVLALMASVVGPLGLGVLRSLAAYAGLVLAGLILHMGLVYPALLWAFVRRGPRWFFGAIRPVQVLAFSTSSSAATLPVTLACSRDRLGVAPEIGDFCLPLGATINMDGTALYQAVAALFIAQVYGIHLGTADQITLVVTTTLASIGTAAIPGAGIPMLAMILSTVGLPVEGVGIILGVDRILDMCRTVVNVTGDLVGVVIVGRSEGKLGDVPGS
jgi:Na+/H+-dicarboxylate symporter